MNRDIMENRRLNWRKLKSLMRFYLILFCFVAFSALNAFAQKTDFYDEVLEIKPEYWRNLVALKIESSDYNGRTIIQNMDLFLLLKETKGFDEKAYRTFMTSLLENKKVLPVGDIDLEKSGFIKAPEVKEVSEFAAKGRKAFLDYYFNGRLLKGSLIFGNGLMKYDVMYAVAYQLFEWKIITYLDDLSALLGIWDYQNLKK